MQYFQCTLYRNKEYLVGWVEEEFAKPGNEVLVGGYKGIFYVDYVSEHHISENLYLDLTKDGNSLIIIPVDKDSKVN